MDELWAKKIVNEYNETIVLYKPNNITYIEQYMTLSTALNKSKWTHSYMDFLVKNERIDILSIMWCKLSKNSIRILTTTSAKFNKLKVLKWFFEHNLLPQEDTAYKIKRLRSASCVAVKNSCIDILDWILKYCIKNSGVYKDLTFIRLPSVSMGNYDAVVLMWLREKGFEHDSYDVDIVLNNVVGFGGDEGLEKLKWVMKVGPLPTYLGANELLREGDYKALRKLEVLLIWNVYPTQEVVDKAAETHSLKVLKLLVKYNVLPSEETIGKLRDIKNKKGRWVKENLLHDIS